MVALSLLSLILATTTLAAPCKRGFQGACKVPASAFSLPPALSALSSPPAYVAMGVGNQNYTCNSAGTYTSLGALSQIFDVSCLFGKPEFSNIQEDAFKIWNECQDTDPLEPRIAQLFEQLWDIPVVGQHYFVDGNNDTLVPVFDFTSSGRTQGNKNAIFYGKKFEDVQSPDGSDNIDWLELQKVSGELADKLYRVFTVKGQPPASCEPGSADITVKYATKYLLTDN